MRAPNQFAGFSNYPDLTDDIETKIADVVSIANDAGDTRFARMRAHLESAIAVAGGPRPVDPTRTGLFWWKTDGARSPGTGVVVFRSLRGNTFYREGP